MTDGSRNLLDTGSDPFSRIWTAFDDARLLPICAWCQRVRIDETWVTPSRATLAAIDERYAFSHTICDRCAQSHGQRLDATTLHGPPPLG